MENGSGVASVLIDNREFVIWLQATAKERMSVISLRLGWFSASGSLGKRISTKALNFCSYFRGFLSLRTVHVLLGSPILLVLTSQTSDLKSHGLELQVASFGAAKSRHSQPIIDNGVFSIRSFASEHRGK